MPTQNEMLTFAKKQFCEISPAVILAFLFVLFGFGIVPGQTGTHEECDDAKKVPEHTKKPGAVSTGRSFVRYPLPPRPPKPPRPLPAGDVSEKSIAVNPKVYVSLCVSRGSVKINGWNRNEVRAFVEGGSKIEFKVRERKGEDKEPVWVEVSGYTKAPKALVRSRSGKRTAVGSGGNVFVARSRCLSGKSIELDVPKNGGVKLRSEISETTVDTIRWADVANSGGSIFLNRIANGVRAQTYRGNITVKDSGGKMTITTTSGDIVAFKTETNDIGDYLKAKSQSGSVTLQSVGQREVNANSVSGTVNFVGRLANYGRYSFGTSYGAVNLAIPTDTSCRVNATYGRSFKSDLPLKDISKSRIGDIVSLSARIGEGSCNLIFKTFSGSIRIRELNLGKPVLAGEINRDQYLFRRANLLSTN